MKGAIKISFPGRDNFTFENDYCKVLDYIKEELEDEISENNIIEIYSNTGIQITNQTVFNNLKESQDDLKLVVKRKRKIRKRKIRKRKIRKRKIRKRKNRKTKRNRKSKKRKIRKRKKKSKWNIIKNQFYD